MRSQRLDCIRGTVHLEVYEDFFDAPEAVLHRDYHDAVGDDDDDDGDNDAGNDVSAKVDNDS